MATRSLNKVFLIGNLTRDPELRYTPKGTAVCNFTVATNREWRSADTNEAVEDTEFTRVVAWGKLGELCSQLLFKGRKVFVEGRLNTSKWDDAETGKKLSRTEVVCSEMVALGSPKSGSTDEQEEDSNVPEIPEEKISLGEELEKALNSDESTEEDMPF